jgi:hypothetical protein
MEMKNKWVYYHAYDEYYDFHRSVQNFEDAGDTHTAYYLIVLTNNDGTPIGWEKTHYIPWDDAINTIYRDGCDNFPEELKEVEIK